MNRRERRAATAHGDVMVTAGPEPYERRMALLARHMRNVLVQWANADTSTFATPIVGLIDPDDLLGHDMLPVKLRSRGAVACLLDRDDVLEKAGEVLAESIVEGLRAYEGNELLVLIIAAHGATVRYINYDPEAGAIVVSDEQERAA